MKKIIFSIVILTLICCNSSDKSVNKPQEKDFFYFNIKNFKDKEYPDNPDIGHRANNYKADFFKSGKVESTNNVNLWNFIFFSKTSDTILIEKVNISEFIPTIPEHVISDPYLSYISCINQEWNRNQVRFSSSYFQTSLPKIVRIDIARNCLNAYLWEVIIFVNEKGIEQPYAHGWFNFPKQLYVNLFEKKNKISFGIYKKPLESWIEPLHKSVNLLQLREIKDTLKINFKDFSNNMYPIEGERKKKYKEIIYPIKFSKMKQLQSDSTLFATFLYPGIYNKKNPRKTELGRFFKLEKIMMFKISSKNATNKDLYEIKLNFKHKYLNKQTTLIIGGLDLGEIPILKENEANAGWTNSMGIGNHTFYETYDQHINTPSKQSPYYALLLDEQDKWLDSHKVGMDGPLLHFSDEKRKKLHIWILSFERHALIGHYNVNLK